MGTTPLINRQAFKDAVLKHQNLRPQVTNNDIPHNTEDEARYVPPPPNLLAHRMVDDLAANQAINLTRMLDVRWMGISPNSINFFLDIFSPYLKNINTQIFQGLPALFYNIKLNFFNLKILINPIFDAATNILVGFFIDIISLNFKFSRSISESCTYQGPAKDGKNKFSYEVNKNKFAYLNGYIANTYFPCSIGINYFGDQKSSTTILVDHADIKTGSIDTNKSLREYRILEDIQNLSEQKIYNLPIYTGWLNYTLSLIFALPGYQLISKSWRFLLPWVAIIPVNRKNMTLSFQREEGEIIIEKTIDTEKGWQYALGFFIGIFQIRKNNLTLLEQKKTYNFDLDNFTDEKKYCDAFAKKFGIRKTHKNRTDQDRYNDFIDFIESDQDYTEEISETHILYSFDIYIFLLNFIFGTKNYNAGITRNIKKTKHTKKDKKTTYHTSYQKKAIFFDIINIETLTSLSKKYDNGIKITIDYKVKSDHTDKQWAENNITKKLAKHGDFIQETEVLQGHNKPYISCENIIPACNIDLSMIDEKLAYHNIKEKQDKTLLKKAVKFIENLKQAKKQDINTIEKTILNFIEEDAVEHMAILLNIFNTGPTQDKDIGWNSEPYYAFLNKKVRSLLVEFPSEEVHSINTLEIIKGIRQTWLLLYRTKEAIENLPPASLKTDKYETTIKEINGLLYGHLQELKEIYQTSASFQKVVHNAKWYYWLDRLSFVNDLKIIQIMQAFRVRLKALFKDNLHTPKKMKYPHDPRTWGDFNASFISNNSKVIFEQFKQFLNSKEDAPSIKGNLFFQEEIYKK